MKQTPSFPDRPFAGYQAFPTGRFATERARFHQVTEGRHPEIMVIGCRDARVAPELIFDAGRMMCV
ncbi:hypothetical protein [Achromobacter aloeverae]|uniref:hypothetical protein n=1 Tax=Achromobacter aloeverae TaxID=1750518 RepID=UPI00100F2A3E|nr:hypothetical protein [Achromobacter aloeverae]